MQRDPNRYNTGVYMPIEMAVKIRTVIEGVKVPRKTRAIVHGKKRRKAASTREKTIGDFLVECAEEKIRKVVPSASAEKWGRAVLRKNRAMRRRADLLIAARKKTLPLDTRQGKMI